MQPWTDDLSFMQQSVLISAIRAPDGLHKGHPAKVIWRWLRRCIVYSAFDHVLLKHPRTPGGGSFIGPVEDITKAVADYFYHVDSVPHHAHLHFMHAAEILGYKHPAEAIREWWHQVYLDAVNDMHLVPESEEEMDRRLGDDHEQWQATERYPA